MTTSTIDVVSDQELAAVLTRVSKAMAHMKRSDPSAGQARVDVTALNPSADCLGLAMEELTWLSHYPELETGERTVITVTF